MQPLVHEVWSDKYKYGNEQSIDDTYDRVINGVYANDPNTEAREEARALARKRHIVPAGRITAGAGTDKRVTLINCFVAPRIQDSMSTEPHLPGKGIMDALKDSALTQQMGGGIGMGFSSVRPRGAIVKRTQSVSTGVLPFMDMWNAMCGTVKSSGARRGAMMGTLAIWHPDVIEFVHAKREPGRLTNFNISVLVTDDFMFALEYDLDWDLWFTVPRADGQHVVKDRGDGSTYYVYQTIKARELWDLIIENTYVHAEPGVIFIDRVNTLNNLYYCETIDATNPCGEQPLPPNGDCNLGHVNLAEMVVDPFTEGAQFDYVAMDRAVRCMVRLLDNVLDITQFPTEEQRQEAMNKRREGNGYTGLANALQQLGIRYGSREAIEFVETVGKRLRNSAYWASVELAKERGPFPLFDAEEYCEAPFIKTLPDNLQEAIRKYGIRNAVLLTLAPVGTKSIVIGNVSSGIEPVFSYSYDRKVLQDDGSYKKFDTVYDYGYLKYHACKAILPSVGLTLPDYFVTANDLTVREHLEMQAAAQKYIDASISKTINCPTEMTLEEFKDVYTMAYKMGLKGCTTYRPDPNSKRGSILSVKKEDSAPAETAPSTEIVTTAHAPAPMQDDLEGRRYRIKWPDEENAYYLIINDYVDAKGVRRPFECFIQTKSVQHQQWISALSRTISAIFRREDNVAFLAEELRQVHTATASGMFHDHQHVPSLVAMIGVKIEEHLRWLGLIKDEPTIAEIGESILRGTQTFLGESQGEVCERCSAPAVIKQEGCRKCLSCGHSKCG